MADGDFDTVTRLLARGGPLPIDPLAGRVVAATVEAALFGTEPSVDLGRYRIERRVGQGGGGIVYRGRDPQLDRAVAIKILHAARHDAARLRREAEALASVAHPHVLEIYDVLAPSPDRVVLVTAWIDGCTLEDWLAEASPTAAEILAAFVAVGEGLAAVHAAGLVHRDVKPANVLVRSRGALTERIVLADFGLAQSADAAPTLRLEDADTPAPDARPCVGTPGYMAPEQRDGAPIDPRADQWSFCASLFEALCDELPPSGERARAKRWREAPRARALPSRVRVAVLRGLADDPGRRFTDLPALLRALGPRVRRGPILALAGAAVLGTAAAALLGAGEPDACERAAERVAELWHVRSPEVKAAFAATELAYADDAFARVDVALQRHADRWRSHARASCDVPLDASEQDRRHRCLQALRWDAESLVDELAHADATLVARSASAVFGLSSPASCDEPDHAGLLAWRPDDAEAQREAERLVRALSQARALGLTGRWADAVPRTLAVVEAAEALGMDPLSLVARIDLGRQRVLAGELQAGRDTLDAAYWDAIAGRHDAEAARAAAALGFAVGYKLADVANGRAWIRHAEAAFDRIGAHDERRAELWSHRGSIEALAGRHDEARTWHLRALEIREARADERPDELAHTLNNLGNVDLELGRHADARLHHERALQLRRESLGEHHPHVATSLNNLGSVLLLAGEPALARATFEQALAKWEAILGPDHVDLVWVLYNLATLARDAREPAVARPYAVRALAIAQARLPADHPQLAFAVMALAHIDLLEGDAEAALAGFEHAHRTLAAAFGPTHHDIGTAHNGIGLALRDLGRHHESAAAFARAWTILQPALGDGHDQTMTAAMNLMLARLRAHAAEPAPRP